MANIKVQVLIKNKFRNLAIKYQSLLDIIGNRETRYVIVKKIKITTGEEGRKMTPVQNTFNNTIDKTLHGKNILVGESKPNCTMGPGNKSIFLEEYSYNKDGKKILKTTNKVINKENYKEFMKSRNILIHAETNNRVIEDEDVEIEEEE